MKESDIRPAELFNQYLALAAEDCKDLVKKSEEFVAVNCPGCGVNKGQLAFQKLGFDYVLCQACKSLYVSPRPSADLLAEFYSRAKSVTFWSTHFYKETYEARKEKIFRPRAALVRDILRKYGESPLSIVDVGAGYGIFLEEILLLNLFNTLMAIEPNSRLAAICREKSFTTVQTCLEDIPRGKLQASFATAFEILEHVFDSRIFMESLRNVTQPVGLLLLTTLTVTGFDIQVLWKDSKSVNPPHHLNLLSLDGMKKLIERSGFQLLSLSTPGHLDLDIVRNALHENPRLPVSRFVRELANSDDRTRQGFQDFLKGHCLSSHVQIVARALTRV